MLHFVNLPEAGELTKSRKNRSLLLHPQAREVLQALWAQGAKRVDKGKIVAAHPHAFRWPGGSTLKPDWVTWKFAALVDKAEITPCTRHDCRPSFSTLAQRAGADRLTVKDRGAGPAWALFIDLCVAKVTWPPCRCLVV
jgi:integrase